MGSEEDLRQTQKWCGRDHEGTQRIINFKAFLLRTSGPSRHAVCRRHIREQFFTPTISEEVVGFCVDDGMHCREKDCRNAFNIRQGDLVQGASELLNSNKFGEAGQGMVWKKS